jgi:hypothetical protein
MSVRRAKEVAVLSVGIARKGWDWLVWNYSSHDAWLTVDHAIRDSRVRTRFKGTLL